MVVWISSLLHEFNDKHLFHLAWKYGMHTLKSVYPAGGLCRDVLIEHYKE